MWCGKVDKLDFYIHGIKAKSEWGIVQTTKFFVYVNNVQEGIMIKAVNIGVTIMVGNKMPHVPVIYSELTVV